MDNSNEKELQRMLEEKMKLNPAQIEKTLSYIKNLQYQQFLDAGKDFNESVRKLALELSFLEENK